MRKLTSFQKELFLKTPIKIGDKGKDVKKIQEWIFLNNIYFGFPNATEIDEDFGKATEKCIKDFQRRKNIEADGVVDNSTFFELTKPLTNAFIINDSFSNSKNFREILFTVAQKQLENRPLELTRGRIGNLGPWVRSYCNGKDGNDYFWCMGFIQNIFDIVCDIDNKKLSDFMPISLSCDDVARFALSNNMLIRGNELKRRILEIEPGDLFFKYSPDSGSEWHHVGLIIGISDDGIITTIEGNASKNPKSLIGDTNNGIGVFKKYRNLFDRKKKKRENGSTYLDYYEVYKIY